MVDELSEDGRHHVHVPVGGLAVPVYGQGDGARRGQKLAVPSLPRHRDTCRTHTQTAVMENKVSARHTDGIREQNANKAYRLVEEGSYGTELYDYPTIPYMSTDPSFYPFQIQSHLQYPS